MWFRGRGPGWEEGDLQSFIKLGADDENFYLYRSPARSTTWEPEAVIDIETWRRLRAVAENRWLRGEAPSGSVECGTLQSQRVRRLRRPVPGARRRSRDQSAQSRRGAGDLRRDLPRGRRGDHAHGGALGGRHPAERSDVVDRHGDVARRAPGGFRRGQRERGVHPAERAVPPDQREPDLPREQRAAGLGQPPAGSLPAHVLRPGHATDRRLRAARREPGAADRDGPPGRRPAGTAETDLLEHELRAHHSPEPPRPQLAHQGPAGPADVQRLLHPRPGADRAVRSALEDLRARPQLSAADEAARIPAAARRPGRRTSEIHPRRRRGKVTPPGHGEPGAHAGSALQRSQPRRGILHRVPVPRRPNR